MTGLTVLSSRSEGSGQILHWPLWRQYLFTAAVVGVLTLVRLGLDPMLGWRAPFVLQLIGLFPLAMAVARGPYIVGAVLALALTDVLFMEPRGLVLGGADANLQLAIYAAGAALIPLAAWPARAAHARALRDRKHIRESEERFRLALSHSQVVVYTTDRDMRATWIFNPPPHFQPEDVIGKDVDEILPAGGGSEIIALQREVLESGRPGRRTVSVQIAGERIVYDLRAEPLMDSAGKVVGIAAAASDITGRVQMEEELNAAHEQLSLLWRQCEVACEAGRMGEWSWSAETHCVRWSPAMRRIMGAPPISPESNVLAAEQWLEFIHPEDREHAQEALQRALERGELYEIEVRVLDDSAGEGARGVRWVEMRGQVERDGAGRAVAIVGVALDVTVRRLYEEALARQNSMLVRSNDDLEDFAYIVSHDLKEPLRGISNYAGFVIEDDGEKMSQESRDKLKTIEHLAGRMSMLLDALLQYSRVGRTEMGVMDCSLGEVAAAARQRLGPWLKERNATVEIDGDLPRARCDGVRMEEVFVNLITNAVKYNDSEERVVRISAGADGAIRVQDNGIGIPARSASEIFRMFRRLHARDAYEGGAGSGLAITKKIIERHSGRIWVESEPGRGSTFYFTLGAGASASCIESAAACTCLPSPGISTIVECATSR